MARTVYALTQDGIDTSFPEQFSTTETGNERYSVFTNPELRFPSNLSKTNDNFQTPVVYMNFLNPSGDRMSGVPTVYIKAPPNFSIMNTNNYEQSGPIFGAGSTDGGKIFNAMVENAGDAFAQLQGAEGSADFVFGAKEAFEYSIKNAGQNVLGFITSAGLNNAGQYEFLAKKAINPMQQQLFKGPAFRRYQMPFNMKPRNLADAEMAASIVSVLKVAAGASVPQANDTIAGVDIEGLNFTFGYPHLVQFDIMIARTAPGAKNSEDVVTNLIVQKVFRSKPCVIESVISDYGGQKINFGPSNYPTETNLTVSLIEVTPRTLSDATTDAGGRSKGWTLQ